jgi:hypothetical protein
MHCSGNSIPKLRGAQEGPQLKQCQPQMPQSEDASRPTLRLRSLELHRLIAIPAAMASVQQSDLAKQQEDLTGQGHTRCPLERDGPELWPCTHLEFLHLLDGPEN